MFNFLDPEASNPTPQEVASSFRWIGWIGFWLQALLGFIPIFVVIANGLFRPGIQRTGASSFSFFLAIACAIALLFSTYWTFRYTQMGNKLEIPDLRPAKSEVKRDLKIGLITNLGIMIAAVIIALLRVGELTFKMLSVPQGSTVIAPGQLGTTINPGALITPSNMIAIQAMVNGIAAGLVGTIVALLLLYRVGQHRNSYE